MRNYLPVMCLMLILLPLNAVQAGSVSDVAGVPPVGSPVEMSGNMRVCSHCHVPKQGVRDSAEPNSEEPLWSRPSFSKATDGTPDGTAVVNASSTDSRSSERSATSGRGVKLLVAAIASRIVQIQTPSSRTADQNADIRDEHPVNVTYDRILAAKMATLVVPVKNPDANSPAQTGVFTSGGRFLPLFDGKIQCSTCHDFHDNGAGPLFLRDTTAGDAMCKACHAM